MFWNVGRQAFDLNFTIHEIEDSALLFHTNGLALKSHGHRDRDGPVHGDAVEIDMQQVIHDRIALVFFHQHLGYLSTIDRQTNNGVGAGLGMHDLHQQFGVD